MTGYKVALQAAQARFSPEAKLYAVLPSSIMISNLGGLPVLSGWFYRFKIAGSRREFIVQVVDGNLSGTTLAEAAVDVKPIELPIDPAQVKLDSPQVFAQFEKFAAQQNIKISGTTYDLELINPQGGSGYVWSVVDPAARRWLYSISATSGAEVPNPHQ
ncbi:MAG: hypothetical protein HYR71_02985 [Chloroflexi bacterium]|nr:hypothetical protein [Chloroflexota bacterium]